MIIRISRSVFLGLLVASVVLPTRSFGFCPLLFLPCRQHGVTAMALYNQQEEACGLALESQLETMASTDPPVSRSSVLSAIATVCTTATVAHCMTPSPAHASTSQTVSESVGSSKNSAWQESLSGSIAGIALSTTKTLVKYPLDTATVRLQMPDSKFTLLDLPNLFKGSYKGVEVPLVSNVPNAAIFFAVKDACKEALRSYDGMPRWLSTSIAVGTAQFPYWLVRNPAEVAKTRSQAGVAGYGDANSPWEAFLQVGKDAAATNMRDGNATTTFLDGYYVGYWENIAYAYPADVLKFVIYEQFSGGRKNLPPLEGAAVGAAATAVAQFFTTPLDVVRNRLMMREKASDDSNETSPSRDSKKSGYWQTLTMIAKNEGLPGLFAGVAPRVGKAMLSGAIQFATYEETKQQMAKFFQKSEQSQ